MKKFFKVCAIIVIVLAVVGGIMLGISSMVVGPKTIGDMVTKVTDGRIVTDFREGFYINFGDNKLGSFLNKHAIYNIDDADTFNKNHDIWKGDVKKTLLAEGGIKKWSLGLGGCTLAFKDSGNESYYVEYTGSGKSQAYVEGEVLYVKVLNSDWGIGTGIGNKEECLTLYVPMSAVVEEAEVDLGAGQMVMDDLKVQKLVLDLGAGQVTAKNLQADQLRVSVGVGEVALTEAQLKDVQIEVGAGNCEINGAITGNVEAGCAMGNLTFELTGKETDFNYDIQCVSGNVVVGEKEYSGLAQEQSINNNATKTMEVECAMGNVEILFE